MSRLELIKYCLNQRCDMEDNYSLNRLQEWFYTVKAVICIMFNSKHKDSEWSWYSDDFISVAMHSFSKFYNWEFGMDDASFMVITVGHGVFSNWKYRELRDGWL
jgi:hypothetical protein